jgi:hypothetical protein
MKLIGRGGEVFRHARDEIRSLCEEGRWEDEIDDCLFQL